VAFRNGNSPGDRFHKGVSAVLNTAGVMVNVAVPLFVEPAALLATN
jgi:hypothetical protein